MVHFWSPSPRERAPRHAGMLLTPLVLALASAAPASAATPQQTKQQTTQQSPQGDLGKQVAAVEAELARAASVLQTGDRNGARGAIRKALQLADPKQASAAELAALAPALWKLGQQANRIGDLEAASDALEAVLRHRTATLADEHTNLQVARNSFANVRHAMGDFDRAKQLKQKVLDVFSKTLPDEHLNLQMARGSLASTLMQMGDLTGALALQEKALAVLRKSLDDDHEHVVRAEMSVSTTLSAMGRAREALPMQRRVLAQRSKTLPDHHPDLQRTRQGLAATLTDLGAYREALALERKVEAVFAKMLPPNHPYLQSIRGNLATSLRRVGDVQGALAMQRDIVRIESAMLPADHPALQRSLGNLANTLNEAGDPYGALTLQRRVLASASKQLPEDHPELHMARANLAGTLAQIGDTHGALALYERVLQSFERTTEKGHAFQVMARGNLAALLDDVGDFEASARLGKQAWDELAQVRPENDPDLLRLMANHASTLKRLGKVDEALQVERRVVAALREQLPEDHPSVVTAVRNLGNSLHLKGDLDEARKHLTEALQQYAKKLPNDAADLQGARCSLAQTLEALGELEQAAQLTLAAANGSIERLRDHVVSRRTAPAVARQAAQPLSMVARLLEPSHELPEAVARPLRETGLELLVASRSCELHGNALRRTLASQGGPALRRLGRQLAEASRRLEEAIALPRAGRLDLDGNRISRDDAIQDATQAKDRIEREWLALIPTELRKPASVAVLAGQLADDEAAIAFCTYMHGEIRDDGTSERGALRYGAFVLLPSGSVSWHPLSRVDDIADKVARVRELARTRGFSDEAGKVLLADLDKQLFASIREVLPAATRRLAIELTYDLQLLPIDALAIAEQRDVQLVWSLRTLLQEQTTKPAEPTALVLGSVDYDTEPEQAAPLLAGMATPPLDDAPRSGSATSARSGGGGEEGATADAKPTHFPGLRNEEAQAVHDTFADAFPGAQATMLREARASEASVTQSVAGRTYIHLATHGYFAPERSWTATDAAPPSGLARFQIGGNDRTAQLSPYSLTGLALTGANLPADELGRREGILTAQEISNLDLTACHLVTLSACESSLGIRRAGTGLASLRNAFHAAGARFVLASLWKVSDRATERMMRDFYTQLWVRGKAPHAALAAAKDAARDRRAPMRDWAGWVLTGR